MAPPVVPSSVTRRLPARDFVILPLLCLLTVLAILIAAELGARLAMPERSDDTCLAPDPVLNMRPRPLCSSRTKAPEGEWTENRYNDCGYRSQTSCHAPLNGASRLVVLGSSTSWGYRTPLAQTWYARAGESLSRRCGLRVDIQNLGGILNLSQIASRVPEALLLHPDAVVMIVSPFDLEEAPPDPFRPATAVRSAPTGAGPTGLKALQSLITDSRAIVAAQHFLFRQPGTYIPLYLRYGDKADFLRPPFTAAWRRRLAYADAALGYIADSLHRAGVPFVLVFTPQQAQADIVAVGKSIGGVDPFAIDAAMARIAARHDIEFSDITPVFATLKNAPDYYLNVDGHLNGLGNRLLATAAESSLTRVAGSFGACTSSAAR